MRYLVIFLLAIAGLVAGATYAIPDTLTAWGLAAERSMAGLRLQRADVGAAAVPYLEGGKGEPLVLIHGFAGDKDNFTRAARYLTPHYRVIIPDLPGFGEAARDPAGKYGIADQARHLHAFLQKLGISRVHLGGNSMGGFIASEFAATYPAMTASVWLIDPAGTATSFDIPWLHEFKKSGDSPLLARKKEDIGRMVAMTMHKPPYMPGFALDTVGRRAVNDLALHSKIMRDLQGEPMLEDRYQSIAAPALIVWGDKDQVLNPAGAASFKALFPASSVVIMKDVGHLPMLEAPEQSTADYVAFRRTLR